MEIHVAGRFLLGRKLGSGSFGEIYMGRNLLTQEDVAIKLEPLRSKHRQLLYESKLYKVLNGGVGIPVVFYYGVEGDYNVMVMELLGPSLEDLFLMMGKQFCFLPWQGMRGGNKKDKYDKILDKKIATTTEMLCRGFPHEFITYLNYCRSLRFEDRPDYAYLRRLFKILFFNENYSFDFQFDWSQHFECDDYVDEDNY
uniref:Casein kinase I-like n=1 Tax=Dermatophagoides pteronyssinus TaxID=6956 RepID=A0A6P6Y9Z1_DERPT|nr:casein kinase I-like [Dermatophagoides pteronyssinus]